MRAQNYGGFTPTLPAIDIRFASIEQVDHFERAWRRPGRPDLPDDAAARVDLMSIGTVIEHEVRHLHDFLLNRDLLVTSWLRRRMFLNAMPAVTQLLKSHAHDVIPFPLVEWASLPETRRAPLRASLSKLFPERAVRFWNPKLLRRDAPATLSRQMAIPRSDAQAAEHMRMALEAVRADTITITPLRNGPDQTPVDQLRFTPRFAFELSALNAQLHAVFKTYGIKEGFEFVAHIADEGTCFSRFFFAMLRFFGTQGRDGLLVPEDIDFPKLNAFCFWMMTGCRDDGTRGHATTRLTTLIEAARDDWTDVFPPGMTPPDLFAHWESKMGVTPHLAALDRTQIEMDLHVQAALELFVGEEAKPHRVRVETFSAVLECRRALLLEIKADPQRYIDPMLWMEDLKRWPECPVHLRFSSGRMGLPRDHFSGYPPHAIYNLSTNLDEEMDKAWVGDVFLQSFYGGMPQIPLEEVARHQQQQLLLDTLLEPDQVSALDDTAMRMFVRETYGKELVRLL